MAYAYTKIKPCNCGAVSYPHRFQSVIGCGEEDQDNDCRSCAGTGEGQYDGTRCFACKGRGILKPNNGENDES